MGLFSFFKKKETQEEPPAPQFEVKVQTRWVETEVNLEGLDKVQVNCYGNYLYPPMADFVVRGTNATTNRKNKRRYSASDEAAAIRKAEADGLTGPFEITLEPADEPTERQLEYAKDLDIVIPKGACKWDVSALITRVETHDEKSALPGVLEFLAGRGWCGSALVGYNDTLEIMWRYLEEPRDGLAFYAYYIEQAENNRPLVNFDTDPRKGKYFEFADYAIQNTKIVDHYNRWRQDGCWSTAKTWGIYKDYKAYREA